MFELRRANGVPPIVRKTLALTGEAAAVEVLRMWVARGVR